MNIEETIGTLETLQAGVTNDKWGQALSHALAILKAYAEKITEKNIDIIRNEFTQDLANSLKTGNKPKYRTFSIAIVTELKGGL